MRYRQNLVSFAASVLLAATSPWAASAMDDPHSGEVDSLFRSVEREAPGAAVLVTRNGRILYERGYGLADVERQVPITPTTRFCIGSVTKQFTAAAIIMLSERGHLRLDEPAQTYLPEFAHGDITIRHLLTHTSGLPDFVTFDQANTMPLDFTPGDRLNYSNTGYGVLGKIIERVSGRSYAEFLQQNIFEPLRMKSTGMDSAEIADTRARGYLNAADGYQATPRSSMEDAYAAGGLYSTVEDLYQWDQAWYDDRLLQSGSIEAAQSPVRLNDGRSAPYGFGWMITELRGLREVSHGGDINGFNAFIARYPDQHFSVIVLSNIGMRPAGPLPMAADLAHSIAEIYLGNKMEPEKSFVPARVEPDTLRSYVGRYRLDAPQPIIAESGEIFTITFEDGRLMGESKAGKGELLADSATAFHPEGFPVTVTFLSSGDGRVDELLFSLMGLREFRAHRID